jgi:hypothetical protein
MDANEIFGHDLEKAKDNASIGTVESPLKFRT